MAANPIIFIPLDDGGNIGGSVYSIERDGSNATQLETPLWQIAACKSKLIAGSFYDGTFSPGSDDNGNHLKLITRDDVTETVITNLPADQSQNFIVPFSWSPNEKQLVLAYQETTGPDGSTSTASEGILVVNADNSGSRKVRLGPSDASHVSYQGIGRVAWAADGRRFVYTSPNVAIGPARQVIRFCQLDGSGVTTIATGPDGTDWYLLDVFKDNKGMLVKHVDRSTHAVTFYKLGYDGLLASLYSDPTGSLYGNVLVERDAVLSPDNLEILMATSAGMQIFSLKDGSTTPIYSAHSVYRVSWDPPPLIVGSIAPGPGAAGIVRMR